MSEELSQRPSRQAGKKEKMSKEAIEQSIEPQLSYWPIVLAAAIIVMLIGLVIHPIIMIIGVVLTVAAIIGWGLERR